MGRRWKEGVEDIIRRLKIEEETEEEEKYSCDVFTEEILLRLPADHLVTLKTVCKNWLQIISSPYFVGLHLKNQRQIRVVAIPWVEPKMNIFNGCDVETKEIRFPAPISEREFKIILGSCDGLICLFLPRPELIMVYNPSTGKCLSVQLRPEPTFFIRAASWFGHHPSGGEYVLVCCDFSGRITVYNFSRGGELIQSARFIVSPSRVKFWGAADQRGILLHGALHWPATTRSNSRLVIFTYHLEHNNYSEISAPNPNPFQVKSFKLGVNAEGCLFAIFNTAYDQLELEMWIMKEYGVEQSWVKHANIVGYSTLSPLGLFPNGDLILKGSHRNVLVKYSFKDNKVVRLIINADHPHMTVCVDTLVPPSAVLTNT